jgi:hypothetical protein
MLNRLVSFSLKVDKCFHSQNLFHSGGISVSFHFLAMPCLRNIILFLFCLSQWENALKESINTLWLIFVNSRYRKAKYVWPPCGDQRHVENNMLRVSALPSRTASTNQSSWNFLKKRQRPKYCNLILMSGPLYII